MTVAGLGHEFTCFLVSFFELQHAFFVGEFYFEEEKIGLLEAGEVVFQALGFLDFGVGFFHFKYFLFDYFLVLLDQLNQATFHFLVLIFALDLGQLDQLAQLCCPFIVILDFAKTTVETNGEVADNL